MYVSVSVLYTVPESARTLMIFLIIIYFCISVFFVPQDTSGLGVLNFVNYFFRYGLFNCGVFYIKLDLLNVILFKHSKQSIPTYRSRNNKIKIPSES